MCFHRLCGLCDNWIWDLFFISKKQLQIDIIVIGTFRIRKFTFGFGYCFSSAHRLSDSTETQIIGTITVLKSFYTSFPSFSFASNKLHCPLCTHKLQTQQHPLVNRVKTIFIAIINHLILSNPHCLPAICTNISNMQLTDKEKLHEKHFPKSSTIKTAVYFDLRSALLLNGSFHYVLLMCNFVNLFEVAVKAWHLMI
jgi:hypothetical protein